MRPCAFFTSYCPTCEKTRFNDKFSLRQVLYSNLSIKKRMHEHCLQFSWFAFFENWRMRNSVSCRSYHCCSNRIRRKSSKIFIFTTSIWPTTDRIPNSLIFKRMQIKWIVDSIRAFSFVLTNWNKEPDKERIYRWEEFFHFLLSNLWKNSVQR